MQKRIYQSLGGTRDYDQKIWEAFGDRVGWRHSDGNWLHYYDLTYDLDGPVVAHLPSCSGVVIWVKAGLHPPDEDPRQTTEGN